MDAQTAGRRRRITLMVVLAMLMSLMVVTPAIPGSAVPIAGGDVIDDFNDGDAGDWGFFGGNAAGGGGGALDDRPYEGTHYFSTGWGGQGTASGFYGGAFRNFDDAAQVTPPADPWFNVWVLNQSNATVDAYTLEITLREDLDGNGWTNGAEDSFRLDTTFTSSDFDDQWALVSAPLSSLTNLFTGGDGSFNGDLDEIVLVVAGVVGEAPSTVEVDFDLFAFSSGGPLAFDSVVFDDMEHGDPFGNGWFAFNGSVGGGGMNANNTDLPPVDGGVFSLETGWGSGGTPGFYGGFGRTYPVDISGTEYFNFWINPNPGQEYTLEINLQDDDNVDGAINPPDDDEFQFNCVVSPTGPCATSGGGWQLVSIPLADFFDDNGFLFGGNGVLDPTTPERGGNGELINVVIAVIGSGSDVNFRTDNWTFTRNPAVVVAPPSVVIVDDFEGGVAPGTPCAPGAPPLNFCTFSGAGSVVSLANPSAPPAPELPEVGTPNSVLQMDVDVTSYAGFIHGFESGGAWVSQDWSTREGLSMWFHGTGSDTTVFIDLLDNRSPGSTTDDAERFSVSFVDDFTGWQLLQFPFSSFVRKDVGNGAPNDGLGLFEVHGYAIGTLGTGGSRSYYIDQVGVYGAAEPPALAVGFALPDTPVEEGSTGDVTVKLNRAFGGDDPESVSVDYATEFATAAAGEEYTPTSGTLTFTKGGPTEQTFAIETFDDTKWEGEERIVLRLSGPVDVELSSAQATALIVDNDDFDPNLLDDFEQGAFQWDLEGPATIDAVRVDGGAVVARPGQDAIESQAFVEVPLSVDIDVQGNLCRPPNGIVPVNLLSTAEFDATSVDHTTVTLGAASEVHVDRRTGLARRHVEDVNSDGLDDLVFHFRAADVGVPCQEDLPFNGTTVDGQAITAGGSEASLIRDFPQGQDWTGTESVSFWYYGAGGGEEVVLTLKDNRAPDPGPSGWELAWSDEFDEPAGTVPNSENWGYELNDGAAYGIPGWGNSELQFYTDDPANASTDGNGNLVISLEEADGSLECYYGTCEYTSARLTTEHKAEFAYGRIESRLRVPEGGDGLWPAFWSLGADIDRNPWPAAGEIDFMEYVSRLPEEVFGTIHGPGYNGGNSFGGIYGFGERVDQDYHTFTVEWEPNLITWYVDGIQFHRAEPSDVTGPWVFDKPFYLLLNLAAGGNFGGPLDPDNVYPQEYMIDYVRVYSGPDTAERFEASFVDSVAGWQQVTIPMTDFARSADQPADAPNDGLTLTDVWGYGFEFPNGTASGEARLDLLQRVELPPPTDLVVTNLNDSGEGSLRNALGQIAEGGTITFDPALAGGTIGLSSGQLVVNRSVEIDASDAPGVVVSGNNASRVFQIAATATVSMIDLEIADGAAAPQGGGVLNLGTLSLERVVVRNNTENSAGPANFEFGGGGIYNGAGATLNLTDSTVADNASLSQPAGGIYGFFGSTLNITRSVVSGNAALADVAGGIRSLGDMTIIDSTISGNTSSAWHGGGIFATDGMVTVLRTEIVDNMAPSGTAGGIMVATFGAPVTLTLQDSIVTGNVSYGCQVEGSPTVAVLTSLGGNTFTDSSCNPIGSDVVLTP